MVLLGGLQLTEGNMIQKSILIVEDDHDTRLMLKKRLESQGYRCLLASSVEAALQIVNHDQPDLILLDLMFKKLNGTTFLNHLRAHASPAVQNTPVLVMSGCHEKDVVDYVMNNGAVGFIKKPINPQNLLGMVKNYIAAA